LTLINGFEWNEASSFDDSLNNGLITLLAFDRGGQPTPIGTAFVITDSGDALIAVTVAHNFDGIHRLQVDNSKYHPTALPEFLPDPEPLNLDSSQLIAICFSNGDVHVGSLGWVCYDRKSDIAVCSIEKNKNDMFSSGVFELDERIPQVGDEVALIGYAKMQSDGENINADTKSFSLARNLLLRRGRITNIYPDGHLLCRGACVETSIPVYPGMSGSPVMLMMAEGEPMKPFGVVSSDPKDEDTIKLDRSTAGSSIVALIKPQHVQHDGAEKIRIDLNCATIRIKE